MISCHPRRKRPAAFFDIDGTLLPEASLEMRFVRFLWERGEFGMAQGLRWMAGCLRYAARGWTAMAQENKAHWWGIRAERVNDFWRERWGAGGAAKRGADTSRLDFFAVALARAEWHAAHGHAIVLISGTLAPLARHVARELAARLDSRGLRAAIHTAATRLEEQGGRWTGRVVGVAVTGREKARAMRRLAWRLGLDLDRSFAYGNHANDRWMLASVAHPLAVDPSPKLALIARAHGWPVAQWTAEEMPQMRNASEDNASSKAALPGRQGVLRERGE